ncbi:Hypothetical protein KVN_LOCUS10 [uncultured virus]|nr:Hypothetical protein KVN_LOCUS10 [uncultured virus]
MVSSFEEIVLESNPELCINSFENGYAKYTKISMENLINESNFTQSIERKKLWTML